MERWLKDSNAIVLQHVQESGLSGIVETEEEKF
jgi:hypothetical protein